MITKTSNLRRYDYDCLCSCLNVLFRLMDLFSGNKFQWIKHLGSMPLKQLSMESTVDDKKLPNRASGGRSLEQLSCYPLIYPLLGAKLIHTRHQQQHHFMPYLGIYPPTSGFQSPPGLSPCFGDRESLWTIICDCCNNGEGVVDPSHIHPFWISNETGPRCISHFASVLRQWSGTFNEIPRPEGCWTEKKIFHWLPKKKTLLVGGWITHLKNMLVKFDHLPR